MGDTTVDPGRPGPGGAGGELLAGPRVVALDYDGTITESGHPPAAVLDAIAAVRAAGVRVVLVTGRILDELAEVFPDAGLHVDVVVAENGAVVSSPTGVRRLARAVDPRLAARLRARGIPVRQGLVIVACHGRDEHVVVDELVHLGLECQLVRSRTELMVLPSGVDKGTGLRRALAVLGFSRHDVVAVGDAENDHSLLELAEVGVAVANAVPSLLEEADVVLDGRAGDGVTALLDGLRAGDGPWTRRRGPQLELGADGDGRPVELPARPSNVLIAGGSGDGKSYLAGLLAEQLVELEYSVVVVDSEGEHSGLGVLRSVVVLGGDIPPPSADVIVSLLQRSDVSVVIDLSGMAADEQQRYLRDFPVELEASRRARGRPHWVFVDEAHRAVPRHEAAMGTFDVAAKGSCLITWRPDQLPSETLASLDTVLALTSPCPSDALIDITAAVCGQPKASIAPLLSGPTGRVVVARRGGIGPPAVATVVARSTAHFRHVHKYEVVGTGSDRRFWFRSHPDRLTGATAANLGQLEAELAHCDRSVLRHHAPRHDVSRWVEEVFHDQPLAAALRAIETTIDASSPAAVVEAGRLAAVRALQHRQCSTPEAPAAPP